MGLWATGIQDDHAQVRGKMGLVMSLNGCEHGNESMGIK